MTSGSACLSPRWWSTVPAPMDSKGRWAIASSAWLVVMRPRRTPVRSLRSRAGSMSVHALAVPPGLRRIGLWDLGLGSALESFQVAQEKGLHLGRRRGVVHLAAEA